MTEADSESSSESLGEPAIQLSDQATLIFGLPATALPSLSVPKPDPASVPEL